MVTEVVEVGELDLDLNSPDIDRRLMELFEQFQAEDMTRRSFQH
jgi:hypothetical protein